MNIEQGLINALSTSPLALVLFWMVWVGRQDIKEKNQENREMTNKVLTAFDSNTKAFTSFEKTQGEQMRQQQEQTHIIISLSDKITDVLTKR